jgi:hypothetical protein
MNWFRSRYLHTDGDIPVVCCSRYYCVHDLALITQLFCHLYPAEVWYPHAMAIYLKLIVGESKAIALAFLLEHWVSGSPCKEVLKGLA